MSVNFAQRMPAQFRAPKFQGACCAPQKEEPPTPKEHALVIAKPDAMERGLLGKLITQLEHMKFGFVKMKVVKQLNDTQLNKHYEEHVNKGFYPALNAFMKRGPVLMMVVEGGKGSLERLRAALGKNEKSPGTIRGRFAKDATENLLHVSDSHETAKAEIGHFFPKVAKTLPH